MYATTQPRAPHRAGNASDFIRALMADHGPYVLASVIRMVHDHGLAEDVMQETMVRAWRNFDHLDRETGMRGWLLRVARNIAIDSYRAKSTRPVEVAETAAHCLGVPDPSDAVLRAIQVRAALARLNEAHRAVLRECYFNGSTLAEAAQTLGIPLGTLKSRLSTALRHLRDQLADLAEAA